MLIRFLSFLCLNLILGLLVLSLHPTQVEAATNLVSNSSFETGGSGMTPWDFSVTSPASATLTQDTTTSTDGSDSAQVDITTANAASYFVQLRQFNISVAAGKTYTVSFDAKASSNRTITMTMQQSSSPFAEYGHANQNLTTSWATYTSQFTMGITDSNAAIEFSVANDTGDVWFDNVSVVEDSSVVSNSEGLRGGANVNYGMNAHFYTTLSQAQTDIDTISSAGLTNVRFDVDWKNLEPSSKGNYDSSYLTKLDGIIDYAQSKNITPIITFLTVPGWANSNCGDNCPPTDPQDYADAIGFLANRYSANSNIEWEVWNEPNQTAFWSTGADAYAYTQLLRKSYTAIKAANSSFLVLGGSIAFNDQTFLKGMYAAGAKGYFNGLAIHPYAQGHAPDDTSDSFYSFQNSIEQMESTMADYGDTNMPEYITEFGWDTDTVSESTRADYLKQAADLAATYDYVAVADPYTLRQDSLLSADDPWGLILTDGTKTSSWTSFVAAALINSPLPVVSSPGLTAPTSGSGPVTFTPCQGQKPTGVPELFQIDVKGTTANLYFAPGGNPYSSFTINYGEGTTANLYSYTFDVQPSGGALSLPINFLKPNTLYTFQVRANNDCVPGDWSNLLSAKAGSAKSTKIKNFYLKN